MSTGVFLNNSPNISTQDICVEVRLLPRLSHFTTRKPLLLRACRRCLLSRQDLKEFSQEGTARLSERAEKAHFENTSFRNTCLAPY
jgi:hypothetical protein